METVVIFHSQGQAIFANLSLPNVHAQGIIMCHGLEARGFFDLSSGRRLKKQFLHDIQHHDVSSAVGKISCPLLIIHGSADEDVPVENAHHLYEKAKAPKRLKIIEGGNHGFNDPTHLEQVISLTSNWLKRYL